MVRIFLKEVRNRKNITTRALAEMSGISRTYINEIEAGKKVPSIEIICRLASALNVPPCYLYHCSG